jgi:hypothetical protein
MAFEEWAVSFPAQSAVRPGQQRDSAHRTDGKYRFGVPQIAVADTVVDSELLRQELLGLAGRQEDS